MLPENYDIEQALKVLEYFEASRKEDDSRHLLNVSLDQMDVTKYSHPPCWRLTVDEEETAQQEVVFSIIGVLSKKDLPPILHAIVNPHRKRTYIRQSVQITGLGTAMFQQYIDRLQDLHEMFSRCLPEGSLDPLNLSSCIFSHSASQHTHSCIDLSTRYFTAKNEDPINSPQPINPLIDPKGYLAAVGDENFFYGIDNEVLYFRITSDTKERPISLKPTDPVRFRVGDIVEAQLNATIIPIAKGRFIMKMHLRALALLFPGPYKIKNSGSQIAPQPEVKQQSTKRKVGYSESDVVISTARKQMANMSMNETQ